MKKKIEIFYSKIFNNKEIIVIFFISSLVVTVGFYFLDLSAINNFGLDGAFSDQPSYITTALNIVNTSKFETNVIFPSILSQEQLRTNVIYLPGYFYVLASFYFVFGYSVFVSLLPNIIAYILLSCEVFIIAHYFLKSKNSALKVTLLFLSFPYLLIFTFAAMQEIVFLAIAMFVIVCFIKLKFKHCIYFGPILFFLHLSFRETSLALLPIIIYIIYNKADKKYFLKNITIFSVLTLLVMFTTFYIYRGRATLLNYLISGANAYELICDAFFLDKINFSLTNRIYPLLLKIKSNLIDRTIFTFFRDKIEFIYGLIYIFIQIPFCIYLYKIKKERVFISFFLSFILIGLFLVCIHIIDHHRSIRHSFIFLPFLTIVLYRLIEILSNRKIIYITILIINISAGFYKTFKFIKNQKNQLIVQANNTKFIESINHDNKLLLVGPPWISYDYSIKKYPVKYSLIPSNFKTLKLLDKKYEIGTLVIDNRNKYNFTEQDLINLNFKKSNKKMTRNYNIYKKY